MSFVHIRKCNNPANPVGGQALIIFNGPYLYRSCITTPEKVRESGLLNFSRRNFNTLAHLFDVSDCELVFEIKTNIRFLTASRQSASLITSYYFLQDIDQLPEGILVLKLGPLVGKGAFVRNSNLRV